jgi:hypothetical protein
MMTEPLGRFSASWGIRKRAESSSREISRTSTSGPEPPNDRCDVERAQSVSSAGIDVPQLPGGVPERSFHLRLSHMLVGTYLSKWRLWLEETDKLEGKVKARYGRQDLVSGLTEQELAYLELDSLLPARSCSFAAFLASGSNSTLSALSRVLIEAFPGLIDYMATASGDAHGGIIAFLQDYLAFLEQRPVFENGEGRERLINPDYASVVAHWLIQCKVADLEAYRRLVDELAEAAEMDLQSKALARRSSAFDALMEIRRANSDGVAVVLDTSSRWCPASSEAMKMMKLGSCDGDNGCESYNRTGLEHGEWSATDGQRGRIDVSERLTATFVELVTSSRMAEESAAVDIEPYDQGSDFDNALADEYVAAECAARGVFGARDSNTNSMARRKESVDGQHISEACGNPRVKGQESITSAVGNDDYSGQYHSMGAQAVQASDIARPQAASRVDISSGESRDESGRNAAEKRHSGSREERNFDSIRVLAAHSDRAPLAPREPTPRLGPSSYPPLSVRAHSRSPTPADQAASVQTPRAGVARTLFQSELPHIQIAEESEASRGLGPQAADRQENTAWERCSQRRLQAVMAAGQASAVSTRRPVDGVGRIGRGRPAEVWAMGLEDPHVNGEASGRLGPLTPLPGLRRALPPPLAPAPAAASSEDGPSELDRAWTSMNERLRETWRAMSPR